MGDTFTTKEMLLIERIVRDGVSIQKKFTPEPRFEKTGEGAYLGDNVTELSKIKTKGKKP